VAGPHLADAERLPDGPDRHGLLLEWVLPLVLLAGLLLTYPSWLNKRSSLSEYFNAVYRSRFLGREMVLGVANGVDEALGGLGAGRPHGLMVGWMVVTGVGFVVTSLLLFAGTRRHDRSLTRVYVTALVVIAVASIAVTPYDLFSYALIVALFMAARAGRTGWAVVLVVVGVAVRESVLLTPLILIGALMEPAPSGLVAAATWRSVLRCAVRRRVVLVSALAGLAAYVAFKIQANRAGHRLTFVQHVPAADHLSWWSAGAIALAVAMLAAVRWSYWHLPARREILARRNVVWVLALPYLAVCAVWGIWSEAPRLIMPLLLGECLVASSRELTSPASPARRAVASSPS